MDQSPRLPSLRTLMRIASERGHAIPPRVAAAVAYEVTLGLGLHGDLKPSNIVLRPDGRVTVLDSGAGSSGEYTGGGTTVDRGSSCYLSPEQVRGAPVDARADVFALGVILWEMLVGAGLFRTNDIVTTLQMVLEARVPPPSRLRPGLAPALDEIVLSALEREPWRRTGSAAALAQQLKSFLGETGPGTGTELTTFVRSLGPAVAPLRAAAPPPGNLAARPRRRLRWLGATAAGLAAMSLVLFAVRSGARTERLPPRLFALTAPIVIVASPEPPRVITVAATTTPRRTVVRQARQLARRP